MEQRLQEVNKTEEPTINDSIPFPIEPLHTVPTTAPQKHVINTNDDSRVSSSLAFCPSLQDTPDILPTSSTCRNPLFPFSMTRQQSSQRATEHQPTARILSGFLIPVQQFQHNSRNFRTREPKIHRPQQITITILRNLTIQGYRL